MTITPHRYAVASKEGLAISEHFGHAKLFYIYEVSESDCKLIEKREVSHYCLGQTADQSAMAGILEAIKDCHSVFVAKIGQGPTDKLESRGINAVSEFAWQEIEPSLKAYWAQQK